MVVSQVEALAETLGALELRPEHRALAAMCEGMAAELDRKPSAALYREYLPSLMALLVAGESEEDDGSARLLELVRTPVRTQVRDSEKSGAGDDGAGDRGDREQHGQAVDAVAATGGRHRRGTSA